MENNCDVQSISPNHGDFSPFNQSQVDSPDDSINGETSGINKKVDNKKCGVCGDRALGYNFNAITCESCKAFFRRNALKNKEFRCPFKEECKVDVVTRRFCQKCRLRKCFTIGMKKEWIMSEEQKQKKKQKIEENRARKLGETGSISPTPSSPSSQSPPHFPNNFPTVELSKPQAVVVGTVRSEEPNLKVIKKDNACDVHTNQQNLQYIDRSTNVIERSSNVIERPPNIVEQVPPILQSTEFLNSPSVPILPISAEILSEIPEKSFNSTFPLEASHQNLSTINPQTPNCPEGLNDLFDSCSSFNIQMNSTKVSPISLSPPTLPRKSSTDQLLSDSSQSSNTTSLPFHSLLTDLPDNNVKKEVDRDIANTPSNTTQDTQAGCTSQDFDAYIGWSDFNLMDTLNTIQPNSKNCEQTKSSNMMESIVNTAVTAEYTAANLLDCSTNMTKLNDIEKRKLDELHEAHLALMAPLCEDDNFKDQHDPSIINIINMTEIAIRRLIKVSTLISTFKNLCHDDQIALLKGGCTEMMLLRSVSAYDPDKDSWKIQQDHSRIKSIKMKVLQDLKTASRSVYDEHKKFMLAFEPSWRKDQNIMHLLSAITLFTPQRMNVVHPNSIKHEQSTYLLLLKRYLVCTFGTCEGKTIFYRLLDRIRHLHVLNEDYIAIYLQANTQEVAPLLIEIFDLKQR